MTAERDGAIPLADLAAIASSVQQAVHRIARALNERSGSGRSPHFLKVLSDLEAVGIEAGSAVLTIEAPHDMDELDLDLGDGDAGVQAIEMFVESLDTLAEGRDPTPEIGTPAMKSVRRFTKAVGNHERVTVAATARGNTREAVFIPQSILERDGQLAEPHDRASQIELVGRLYGVNLNQHSYRVEDEFGRTRRLTLGEGLDAPGLARTLLGETVHVTGFTEDDAVGDSDHLIATSIRRAAAVDAPDYYGWDLAGAIEGIAPLDSVDDLVIPDLDKHEFAGFWEAIVG